MSKPIHVDLRFLSVDDEDTVREMLQGDLKEMDFRGEILQARDGQEAMDILAKRDDIDFIISDMVMPNVTGLELLKHVRSHDHYSEVPMLMLTSVVSRDVVNECIQNGASNYLVKPWNKKILAQKLIFCWEKHHGSSSKEEE